jgi:hypothetical protein
MDELKGEVGFYLGYGRGLPMGDAAWPAREEATITSRVKSGLRNFYWPSDPEIAPAGYDWSFLRPVASLLLGSGARSLALPDDFGGIEGQITLASTGSQTFWPVPVFGEAQLRQRYAEFPSSTGRPVMAAVEPLKATTTNRGQRFQLTIWPQADAAYTLQVAYYVSPDYLLAQAPYHLGGAVHAETVLEACLAAAEQGPDDAMGVHSQKFKERLLASIENDRRLKPQALGYNGDRSDLRERAFGPRARGWWGAPTVTVNGTAY